MKTYSNKAVKRAGVLIALLLVFALSLSACSSGGSGGSANQTSAAGDSGFDRAEPAPMAPPMPAPEAESPVMSDDWDFSASVDEVAKEDGGYTNISGSVQSGRKITFSASMSINTKSFDADYKRINDMVVQAGGYIANENTSDYSSYGRNEGRRAYLSARVPAEGYDSFLDRLSGVGDVTNKTKSSEDLTSQYFDTEARIEMLELRKERLMAYLVEAEEAADIVEFERELSNVLYELDNYQGYKRQLDRLVEYAVVDINLSELITPETIGKDGEPLGDRASEAFGLSVNNVRIFLQNAAVFFAGAAPVIALLVIILVIVLVIVRVTRPLRERARDKREEREEKRQAQRMGRQAARGKQAYPAYPQQAYAQAQPQTQYQAYVQQPEAQPMPVRAEQPNHAVRPPVATEEIDAGVPQTEAEDVGSQKDSDAPVTED